MASNDHATFVDNLITSGNRIVSAWLNDLNNYVWRGSRPTYGTTTGAANVYVLTLPATSLYTVAADGDSFIWKAHQTNSGASTFSVVGGATLTPAALQVNGVALGGNEIISGGVYEVTRAGAIWMLRGPGVVGKATTDTLTNKTLTSPVINTPTIVNPTITNPANTVQALVDAASVAWDMDSGAVATLLATNAVGATRAVAAPSHIKVGGRYVLHFTQDATGGRALTWNAVFKGQGGTAIPGAIQKASVTTSYTFDSPDGVSLIYNGYRIPNVQTFNTPGANTYTPTQGMRYILAEIWGPGGSGGGSSAGQGGGGASGGSYSCKLIDAATIGTSQSIFLGTGGVGVTGANDGNPGSAASTFGAILTAPAGLGGIRSSTTGLGAAAPAAGSGGDEGWAGDAGEAGDFTASTRFGHGGAGAKGGPRGSDGSSNGSTSAAGDNGYSKITEFF